MMTFSDRLDNALKEAGYSQKRLAAEIGLSEMTISRYKSGERDPRYTDLKNMARVLNTSVAYLMGETDALNAVPTSKQSLVSEFDNRSMTRQMFDELMMRMAQQNPDLIVHFRDLQKNIDKLTPNDIQGLADAFAKLTGEKNADVDSRLRKTSRHGDL
ncbi:helix-turn-helix domain-containing protein [Cloacibacillus porcorum]|uniref:helix-turn-helix domain-containing protein n=1 Tax=Cloacibacillus porcorum TaxID=1197717 RepID=UPI002672A18D|nr:helix-turn-helix domain-containing protein [Cloacibacillus porcorum]